MSEIDPRLYKARTRERWDERAEAWHRSIAVVRQWSAPATELMYELAGVGPGAKVLDIAAGDGDQSLGALRRVGPEGSVLATDLSEGMLAVARRNVAACGHGNFEARAMDAERLELEDASFDAVICRLGLMFLPSPRRGLEEMLRVLRPGGRASVVVFTTSDRSPWMSGTISIVRRRRNAPPEAVGEPGPFALGAIGRLEGLIGEAGFTEIDVRRVPLTLELRSAAEFVRWFRGSGGLTATLMAGASEAETESIWAEVSGAMKRFETSRGFEAPTEVWVGSGRRCTQR